MAPKICPHCEQEISVCPHCGFSIIEDDDELALQMEEEEQPLQAKIAEPTRYLALGLGCIVVGVFGLIGGLFMMISSFSGILLFLFSGAAVVGGSLLIVGTITTACPACGKDLKLGHNEQRIACPHCQTLCVRNEGYLQVVEIMEFAEPVDAPEFFENTEPEAM